MNEQKCKRLKDIAIADAGNISITFKSTESLVLSYEDFRVNK